MSAAMFASLYLLATSAIAGAEDVKIQIHGPTGDSKDAVQLTLGQVAFKPAPNRPGVSSAVVVGNPQEPGLYVVLVKMEEGAQIPPHTHPDGRVTTVIRGKVLFGLGETVDPSKARAYGPGSVYYTPPHTPHYLIGAGGALLYQEVGMGPSASVPVASK